MFRKQTGFNGLPIEILFEIYKYLSPEEASIVAAVNKISSKIIQGNLFWNKKYERHFPHLYNTLTSQKSINWYTEFRKTYADEYKDLSIDDRRLFSLVKEGDVESLRAKEIALASFDKKDKKGKSLLNWAQQVGNQQVLNYFYQIAQTSYITENKYVVDVSKIDKYGRTILYWSLTCYQDYEQIALLLLQGSKFDEKYFIMQFQPIHIAAREGRLEVVQALIGNKPELLEEVDASGQTPLLWAAANGRPEVVDYLINAGANLNVSTNVPGNQNNGKTPLYWAANNGHSEIVSRLIKAGAPATIALGVMQFQPIHIAAREGRLEVVQALIGNKPELLEEVDASGQTPLLWAAANGRPEVVDYLINAGANLNVSTNVPGNQNNGKTPLYWAANNGHSEVVSRLIKAGAPATIALGVMQFQPIHIAAREGHLEVVQALIGNKPELLEQVDAIGQTPLLLAAANGRPEVVDYLISEGANLNVSTNLPGNQDHGKTPLYWAADNGHSGIVETFLKHGLTPDLAKKIDKSKLNEKAKAEVELLEYIPKRRAKSKYKKSFTFFCYKFNFGFSRQDKIDAANALKNVVFNEIDKSTLDTYKKELNNGDLGSIYRSLRVR